MSSKILAIIPARGGSKRLPGKNIKLLKGKPMIAYAILAALGSKFINRVLVSTDDQKIAELAKKFGAEVPFLRPAELATDKAKTVHVLKHAINYLEEQEKSTQDIIVLIQPTSPLILSEDIDYAITRQAQTKTVSCASACEVSERPEWMYLLDGDLASPFLPIAEDSTEIRKKIYRLNGAVYVTTRDSIMLKEEIINNKSLSVIIMPKERSVDIDDIVDFKLAEALLENKS